MNKNSINFKMVVAGALALIAILIGVEVLTGSSEGPSINISTEPSTEEQETKEPSTQEPTTDESQTTEAETTEPGTLNQGIKRSIAVGTAEIAEVTVESFFHRYGINVDYPEDGVKGAYMTAYGITNEDMRNSIFNIIETTDLNSLVIDFKTDDGVITGKTESTNEWVQTNTNAIVDYPSLMQTLEERNIYPIARVVAFKDTWNANENPDLAFKTAEGDLWYVGGVAYTNPFLKENWDYLVEVGKQAAIAGFREIQFDYVRFPEAFSYYADELYYDQGEYANLDLTEGEKRVKVISDFLAYAREALNEYDVEVSADVFGYIADAGKDESIGQQFDVIAKNVDVICSMIYPSHWGPGYFGYDAPDTEPYGVVDAYAKKERAILDTLETPPTTRPWIQDFTASYLGSGMYIEYDVAEVEAQIRALYDNGIDEFLLWNAGNYYTEGVNYMVGKDQSTGE